MCSKQETAEVLEHEFFKKDGLKDRLMKAFRLELDAEIGKFSRRQIVAAVFIVGVASAAWFSLYYQVQGNTEDIAGDLPKSEAALITKDIEINTDTLMRLETTINNLDNRLREKGI